MLENAIMISINIVLKERVPETPTMKRVTSTDFYIEAIEQPSATPLDSSDSNPTVNKQLDVGTETARSLMWDPARNCYT